MLRIITASEFIELSIGMLYRLAPYNKPRKIDKIVDHILNYFDSHDETGKLHWRQIRYDTEYPESFLKSVFEGCKEFEELNLSQDEYDRGIKVDDPNRPPFVCTSLGLELKEYYDFIDLDAFYQNMCCALDRNFEREGF